MTLHSTGTTKERVVEDGSYIGGFNEATPNARVAHAQVAHYVSPWYLFPGTKGVAMTDLVSADLLAIVEAADPQVTVEKPVDTTCGTLGFN